jgi:hypothetical protein
MLQRRTIQFTGLVQYLFPIPNMQKSQSQSNHCFITRLINRDSAYFHRFQRWNSHSQWWQRWEMVVRHVVLVVHCVGCNIRTLRNPLPTSPSIALATASLLGRDHLLAASPIRGPINSTVIFLGGLEGLDRPPTLTLPISPTMTFATPRLGEGNATSTRARPTH